MNKQQDIKEEDKKKKHSLLTSFIIAILGTLLFHLRFGIGRYGFMPELTGFGYTALVLTMFFIFFILAFLFSKGIFKLRHEMTEEERKKRKEGRIEIIFIFIDLLMTGLFVKLNWGNISAAGIMWGIAQVAAFFAVVWLVFELFNRFKFFPKKIFEFIIGFLIKVCVPMMFLLIIMLGAYQAKYSYQDVFKMTIWDNANVFAEHMRTAYMKIVLTLYEIGQSNPDLWIWLPIAAFFVMTFWLLIRTFTKKEKTDEDKTAEEIIKEALEEEAEEEDYKTGKKKRPFAYNFFNKIGESMKSKKEREKEKKEEEEMKNAKYNIYDAKLIFKELKGGTDK